MIKLLCKIKVNPDGLLLLSILVFFLEESLLAAVIGNVILHEMGHIYMLRRYGVYIRRISIGLNGLCIVCNLEFLPRYMRFLCAVAGPFFGLCGAIVCSVLGNVCASDFLLLFAGVGVILSLFNLLPVKPLDGGRMMEAAVPRLAKPVGVIFAAFVFILGLYIMLCGYGTMLSFIGIFLLLQEEKPLGRKK